jgi:hypothetical protein
VARYLAFLDEQIFKEELIHAIITISAPLYGSPLANPLNKNAVIQGVVQFLSTLLTFPKSKYKNMVPFLCKHIDYNGVITLLDSIINDLRSNNEKEHLRRTLETTRKWLGGLSADENNAFSNLNINALIDSFSVLYSVNNFPLSRIYHGAIQSANNDLSPFVECCLPGILGFLAKPFVIDNHKSIFDAAGKVYKTNVMHETSVSASNVIGEKVTEYENGLSNLNIAPEAHDFIIPTAYQLMDHGNNDKFLGNLVNKEASHISGSDRKFNPGLRNYGYIKTLLSKIVDLS